MDSRLNKLLLLYWTFAKIAACVLGGGLAMLPVIEDVFVNRKKLLNPDELLEMTALSQSVPGIVAANCATYVGRKVAGYPGALAAVLGAITPSFLIILLIAAVFPTLDVHNQIWLGVFSGVRSAITAMIAVTAVRLAKRTIVSPFEAIIIAAALILLIARINPALIILGAIPLGVAEYYRRRPTGVADK